MPSSSGGLQGLAVLRALSWGCKGALAAPAVGSASLSNARSWEGAEAQMELDRSRTQAGELGALELTGHWGGGPRAEPRTGTVLGVPHHPALGISQSHLCRDKALPALPGSREKRAVQEFCVCTPLLP